jgi:hypothetical protein
MPDAPVIDSDLRGTSGQRTSSADLGAAAAAAMRGSLRAEISTCCPDVQAGTSFSLFVKVTNPFDVPLLITKVQSIVPVEFLGIDTTAARKTRASCGPPADDTSAPAAEAKNDSCDAMARNTAERSARQIITASAFPLPQLLHDWQNHPQRSADSNLSICSCILQPGDSTVANFTLRTQNTILFLPASYELPIMIEYEIDGVPHRDTLKHKINVRAPFKSVLYGAIVGAAFGSLLHILLDKEKVVKVWNGGVTELLFMMAVFLITNMLMAVLIVVAFARKKEAQPLITVEDFWGGCFLGAITAYGGRAILDQVAADLPMKAYSSS